VRHRIRNRREDEILAAALSLFNRDDWQLVTIDQIAAKAEIGKGTIYKHFNSKDEIYAQLAIAFFENIFKRLQRIDVTKPVKVVIEATMRTFWESHQGVPEYRRLVRYCRREDFRHIIGEQLSRQLESIDEKFLAFISPVMERGVAEGVLVDKPVPVLILGIHAAMTGLLEMEGIECMSMNTAITPEQMYLEVADFTLRGISKK
jgi:AcrR family transcriptional regulator